MRLHASPIGRGGAALGLALFAGALVWTLGIREPFRWDPLHAAPRPWKTGEVHFREETRLETSNRTIQLGQQTETENLRTELSYRLRITALSPSNKLLAFEKWRLKVDEHPEDSSLEGKTFLVVGGGSPRYSIENPPAARVSPAASGGSR